MPKASTDASAIRATSSGTNDCETYDREAILHDLAHPRNLEVIQKLEQLCGGSATGIFTEFYQNSGTKDKENTAEECRELLRERLRKMLQTVPDTLLHLFTGLIRPGDYGRPFAQKPDWLDMDKLRRGQKFAQDHIFSLFYSEMLAVFGLFTLEGVLKPEITNNQSSTPYTAFRRYLSTAVRIRHWFTEDPWTKGTAAWKDLLAVRKIHSAIERKLYSMKDEEMDTAARIPDPWCPTREMMLKDLSETSQAPELLQHPHPAALRNSADRIPIFNQTEMALVQWSFIGFITSFPERFGVHHTTDEDLEAFCHLWRSIGYQLGIEDKFNYCRGTLEEIRERNRDFIRTCVKPNLRKITPEWEHMMRCIFTGMSGVLPGLSYEILLLHFMETLDLPLPRLYASLSYKDWITLNLIKFFFNYTIQLPGMSGLANSLLNRTLDRAEKFTTEDFEAIKIKLSDYRSKEGHQNV